MNSLVICLIVFILTIISFCCNYFSVPVTGMLGLMLMIATGCLSPEKALAGLANANAVLMGSMFIVAAGLNRTQMISRISAVICKLSHGSFHKVLAGYVFLTCALVQFIPNALVGFSIVFPMALAVCEELKVKPSKMMYSLGITAIGTVVTLPLGAAITNLAQFNGFLEAFEYTEHTMQLMDIFYGRIGILVLVVLYAIFIAPHFAPEIELKDKVEQTSAAAVVQAPLSPIREFIGYGTFSVVLTGMLFPGYIGIANWLLALFGAVFIVASGVLSGSEALKAVHPDIIILYLSTIGIGTALTDTGAGSLIGNSMSVIILSLHNNYLAGLVLFFIPFLLSQFMNNYSIFCIFVPLYILLSKSLSCNPVGPMLLVLSACLTAFMTPMATPTIPVMMGVSGYTIKDLFRMSLLPAALICIVAVFGTMTLYPVF